jgi:hypothetical protein
LNDWLENIIESQYQMKEKFKINGAWSNLAYSLGMVLQAVGDNIFDS